MPQEAEIVTEFFIAADKIAFFLAYPQGRIWSASICLAHQLKQEWGIPSS